MLLEFTWRYSYFFPFFFFLLILIFSVYLFKIKKGVKTKIKSDIMMSFAILYVLIFLLPYFLLALGQAIDYGDYKKNVQKSCESGYYMRLLNHFTHPEAFSSSNYIDGECVIKR
jgi:hypothetical protein